ncbi:MAG: hypothetical protein AB7T31_18925 [Gemmatimonadales bacterium]
MLRTFSIAEACVIALASLPLTTTTSFGQAREGSVLEGGFDPYLSIPALDGRYQSVLTPSDACGAPSGEGLHGDAVISARGTTLSLGSTTFALRPDGSRVSGAASEGGRYAQLLVSRVDAATLAGTIEVHERGGSCVAAYRVELRRAWTDAERDQWEAELRARCSGSTADAQACLVLGSASPELEARARARACALGVLEGCARAVPVDLRSGSGVLRWLRRSGALPLAESSYVVDGGDVEGERVFTGVTVMLGMIETRSRGRILYTRGRPGQAERAYAGALRGLTRALGPPDRECSGDDCSFGRRAVWLFRGALLDLIGGGSEFQLHFHTESSFREVLPREVPPLDASIPEDELAESARPAPTAEMLANTWHCFCQEDGPSYDQDIITVCARTARRCETELERSSSSYWGAGGCVVQSPSSVDPDRNHWSIDNGVLMNDQGCMAFEPCPPGVDPEECARD